MRIFANYTTVPPGRLLPTTTRTRSSAVLPSSPPRPQPGTPNHQLGMEHELAIANAALFAALFRADPTPLTRPDAEAFLLLLDSALVQCSRPNVQVCFIARDTFVQIH